MLPILVTLQYVADTKNSIVDRLTREEKGATAVEYGLIVGLIAVAIIAVLIALGGDLRELFGRISAGVDGAGV
ncbi:Flp family type IVb pilin [Kocuria rosea]|uniref:Flp family type IVb pilin n=1 Tax=Kocuria rosea TaxID=1275 RepID=UPI001166CC34|nr:Flp family type IVb pilin [Kocuria rosea]MEB2526997.1 Flp family type IVb pilin [Kocuria rosea]MEB2616796.1 Flp family type IVb pilin [Kocuria rosea]TQN30094.1 pilus assembly protein Flp/PilA [Kocuria rosea]